MKKILVVITSVIALAAATTLAQMSGGSGTGGQQQQPGGMVSSEQSQQMMSQEMMRDMSGMMIQMQIMMQKLTRTIEQRRGIDHSRMQDMSKVMNDMSVTMKEMSDHMGKGTMDPAVVKTMNEKMQTMIQRLDAMQRGGK